MLCGNKVLGTAAAHNLLTVTQVKIRAECVAGVTLAAVGAVSVHAGLIAEAISGGTLVDVCMIDTEPKVVNSIYM